MGAWTMNDDPVVEPVVLPWLAQSVELEALATYAQIEKWSDEEMLRAQQLLGEITSLMSAHVEPPVEPPVDPPVEPPVDPPPTIPPEPTPPPPSIVDDTGKLLRAKHPPAAARTLSAKPTTLLNVYRNAQPGDHIVLEDGDYGSGYLFDRKFPPDKKVVIRSKTPMGANFTVPPRFTGEGHWLYECRTSFNPGGTSDSFNIKIEANHITVTRCWIQGKDGIASRKGAVGYFQIGWNRFTGRNKTTSSCDHIYFWLPNSGDYKKPTDGPNNGSIHYNYFDDPASTKSAEDHSVYFGATKAASNDLPMMQNVYVDYNFWASTCERTRLLYLKRGCYVRRNTCLANGRNFGIRHGKESIFWANITNATDVHFSGALLVGATPENHHDIRCNEAPNSSIILFCGSETAAPYQAASYALVAANKVRSIEVGVRRGKSVVAAQGGLTKNVRVLLGGVMKREAVHLLDCNGTSIEANVPPDFYLPKTDRLDQTRVGLETAGQGSER